MSSTKPTAGTVEVWSLALDSPPTTIADDQQLLSPDEVARAQRFHRESDRKHWIVAHAALRRILAAFIACKPEEIHFATSEHGKPHIRHPRGAQACEFNLSHSGKRALVAVTNLGPLGIDIEAIVDLPDLDSVAEQVFTHRERSDLTRLSGPQRLLGFYHGWTRKEALIKATGVGLSQSLESIDVSLIPDEPAIVRAFTNSDLPSWQLHSLNIDDGYAAALAIQSALPIQLQLRHYR